MPEHRYKVLRHLIGDKAYVPGDIRVANSADVAHLVGKSLQDLGPVKAKAAPAPKNKAEKPASNKGAQNGGGQ